MDRLSIPAFAKINLGLEIVSRRPDGYHDVVTVLQEVDLADWLTFADATRVSLSSNCPDLVGETNLVLRAVSALQAAAPTPPGVAIYLDKRIPVAAGLGGGSSDAAAALVGLNRFWELGLTDDQLVAMARPLGADVAFLIRGGTQLATGRGDVLTPLPTPAMSVLLVVPRSFLADKTRRMYRALDPADFSDGSRVRDLAAAIQTGRQVSVALLGSGFQRAAFALLPVLPDLVSRLRRTGMDPVLCGAGPTLLALGSDSAELSEVAEDFAKDPIWTGRADVWIVRSRQARCPN